MVVKSKPTARDDGKAPRSSSAATAARRGVPHAAAGVAVGAVVVAAAAGLLFGRRRAATQQGGEPAADAAAGAVLSPPPAVTLAWRDLTCWLDSKNKGSRRPLLQGVTGVARPGRVLCLMGPSGAGKTTLLNCLSGTLSRQKGLHVRGRLTLNGRRPPSPRGKIQGYVTQDDALFTQLTVRETLRLAAALRLPKHASTAAKDAAADGVLAQLGLARCADTRVARISGGERKRLAIAAELLACPGLLFLDEPTSGLDAFSAQSVMQALSGLAKRGHTVVTSLHQPRGSVFSLCDDLVLLADGGQPLYVGPAADAVAHFEAALKVTKPENVTAAEWLSDLAAIDTSSQDAERASKLRVDGLIAAWRAKAAAQGGAGGDGAGATAQAPSDAGRLRVVGPQLSWPVQFGLLLGRAWRQVTRDKAGLISRFGSTLSTAVIFSSVYWRLNRSQAAIQSRCGLMQVVAVSTTMTSLMKVLNVFPRERTLVARERNAGAYSLAPYFAAKLAAELPVNALFPAMFGALVYPCAGLTPDVGRFARFLGIITLESFTSSAIGMAIGAAMPTQAAQATGPAVAVIFIVFGGSWTSQSTVPFFLRWLPNVSLIKQAFEALCVNEFHGLAFDAAAPGDAPTGEAALRRIGFAESTLGGAMWQQARIMLANWALAYAIMAKRAPKYAQIEDIDA